MHYTCMSPGLAEEDEATLAPNARKEDARSTKLTSSSSCAEHVNATSEMFRRDVYDTPWEHVKFLFRRSIPSSHVFNWRRHQYLDFVTLSQWGLKHPTEDAREYHVEALESAEAFVHPL